MLLFSAAVSSKTSCHCIIFIFSDVLLCSSCCKNAINTLMMEPLHGCRQYETGHCIQKSKQFISLLFHYLPGEFYNAPNKQAVQRKYYCSCMQLTIVANLHKVLFSWHYSSRESCSTLRNARQLCGNVNHLLVTVPMLGSECPVQEHS